MKSHGDELMPNAQQMFDLGSSRFLNQGTNSRSQNVFTADDLKRYDAQVKARFAPDLARWLEHGRLVAGDPGISARRTQ